MFLSPSLLSQLDAHLAVVAAAAVSAGRAAGKPAGGSVAAPVVTFLCGNEKRGRKKSEAFCCSFFSQRLAAEWLAECCCTSGEPQSHCSPSSSQPLPHSATPIKSDGDGWFLRHAPPPRTIRASKSCALQVLKSVEPLGGDREHYNNANAYIHTYTYMYSYACCETAFMLHTF